MTGKEGKEESKCYDQRLRGQRFSTVFSGTKTRHTSTP